MESNNKLKEIDIKNFTCCYFDYIMKNKHFDISNILIDKKSYKNILVHDISYKTLISIRTFRIKFYKIVGFISVDGTRYLVLFVPEKYDAIFNRIRYLISQKSSTI